MEHLVYELETTAGVAPRRPPVVVGVVASGNLEVLVEPGPHPGRCRAEIQTSAIGFGEIWQAVLADFAARHPVAGLTLSVNDGGATPAVVMLRLGQAVEEYLGEALVSLVRHGGSYREASARRRLHGLLDEGSLEEILGPSERVTSPHLAALDLPAAFDDGVVVGTGRLGGAPVLAASQEGRFLGGAVGEVHGAKLTGLLQRALRERPRAVLLLLDTGGVRLQEANAGLVAVSEVMRAVLEVRGAGIPVLALVGGAWGCFGGMGIVARCCDAIAMSEEARLGISGPDVIEATCGVEELDASDRAMVWRTWGGKHRALLGEADLLVEDTLPAFREAALALLDRRRPLTLVALEAEQAWLARRLAEAGGAGDALDLWQAAGVTDPERLPLLEPAAWRAAVAGARRERP